MAAAATASSDAGYMMSEGPYRGGATPRQRPQQYPSSSSGRPRAPPSESQGGRSDDEGFEDDEIPTGVRKRNEVDVPRVKDRIGDLVLQHIEEFIEG
jgi:DNA replication licensing factor MCM6